jgi:two-component system, NarL family, sensor histidine kinase LiaS
MFVQDLSGDELGQLTNQFNRMAGQLQKLLQTHQALATLEERNRLARDLHDSVKQQVFALAMQVSSAKMLLDRDVEAAREQLVEAEQLVYQSQQELTALLSELRPSALDGKGLALALSGFVTQWTRQTGITANVQVEGEHTFPLATEEALFRVAQEALANVARHSHATAVQVSLKSEREAVTLCVSDNGRGFDPHTTKNGGMGLYSMRERIELVGGHMHIESAAGKGTTITARCEQVSGHG